MENYKCVGIPGSPIKIIFTDFKMYFPFEPLIFRLYVHMTQFFRVSSSIYEIIV